jgi:CheY-like chemotaxis protein
LPRAILLDVLLPGIDGWEVLRTLKRDPRTRDVPVVIVTVVDEHQVGLALGAVDYFVKPIDREMLLSRLARHALLPAGTPPLRVLVIDDDPASREVMTSHLTAARFEVVTAPDGAGGLRLAHEQQFDLIICDLLMPDVDGFTVIAALTADPATRHTAILVLTAHDLTESEKDRLNGKVLGTIRKGDHAQEGLATWLARISARTPVSSVDSPAGRP